MVEYPAEKPCTALTSLSCIILHGLVSCPFYAIPMYIPFLLYEVFHLLVKGTIRRLMCYIVRTCLPYSGYFSGGKIFVKI